MNPNLSINDPIFLILITGVVALIILCAMLLVDLVEMRRKSRREYERKQALRRRECGLMIPGKKGRV